MPLLKRFEDLVPLELPKKLPTRRLTDHQIELLLESRTPSQAPYLMTQPEIIELRNKLTKLFDAGLV